MARPNSPENLILISLTIGAAGARRALLLPRCSRRCRAATVDLIGQPLSDRLRADLEREKALTLRSIKELEFDRAMGKVSPQDFDEMAARLRARALGLMKQLDAGAAPTATSIEKELAVADRRRSSRSEPAGSTQPIAPPTGPVGHCACGTANDADARFCKSCGARLRRRSVEGRCAVSSVRS